MVGVSSPDDLAQTVRARGVRDERVLAAIRDIPRAAFVPAERAGAANIDDPIPISHGQVTTQPSLSARMIEGLHIECTDRILEVGTGYGFQTALLARLATEVVSIDQWPDMIEQARRNLDRQDIDNVRLLVGDGSCGRPEFAPFDRIIVSAAYPEVPPPLIEQLCVGGRLVQPIGSGGHDDVVVFQRTADGLRRLEQLTLARFVRLRGQHGFPDAAE